MSPLPHLHLQGKSYRTACTLHHHPAWQRQSQSSEMLLLGSWVWQQAQLLTPICATLDADFQEEGALLLSTLKLQKGQRKCQTFAFTSNCFYKAWKNTALHTKAWQDCSSFLGVGMDTSNPGRGAQQHRALCVPETQPLIHCCKCRGQPSCQPWKARMLTFKLLSQTLRFFWFFLLEIQ